MEAAAKLFGLDAFGSVSGEEEVGTFRPRSRALRDGRIKSYLWRIIPDLESGFVPRMARDGHASLLSARPAPAVGKPRWVIFGRTLTNSRPVWGPGS